MDVVLIILGGLLLLVGVIGAVIPVLPGPPIGYVGLLLLHFTERFQLSTTYLIVIAVFVVVVTVLDYVLPVWGAKKFGGTKAGVRGSTFGLIIGFFFGPLGMIFGPFIGAYIGDISAGRTSSQALRSAMGSFVAFLLSTGLKLIISSVMLYKYSAMLIKAL